MGVKITAVGRGIPGDNVPGCVVTNEELAARMLATRAQLVDETEGLLEETQHPDMILQLLGKMRTNFILPPNLWPDDPAKRALYENRWKQFEMDPSWLLQRTGITERRFVDAGFATSDLAVAAIRDCCANAECDPSTIDGLLLGTVTPDHPQTPPTSAIIQHALGIPPLTEDDRLRPFVAGDVTLACTSFMAAFQLGWATITAGLAKRLIVVGADKMVGTFDLNHRRLGGLLADGAGALLLERCDEAEDAFPFGPNSFLSGVDGSYADLIKTPWGGSSHPLGVGDLMTIWDADRYMRMDGPKVLRIAIDIVIALVEKALDRASIRLADLDFLGLHQANPARINAAIEAKLKKRGFTGICPHNGTHFGNTTSGSIPLVLWEAWHDGILVPGMLGMIVAFGGGFSWGSGLFRWPVPSPK